MSSLAGFCEDALQEIFERIHSHRDILRCAAVCKKWRSIVMGNLHRLPQKLPLCYCLPQEHPLPLLMQCVDEEVSGKIEFLCVLDNKSFTDLSVPAISGNWIAGSINGWLFLVEICSGQGILSAQQKINLVNPLTRAQISLPSLSAFEPPKGTFEIDLDDFGFVRKAIIISEPKARSLDGCIVVAIISCIDVLSFCRPGDEKWTNIRGSPNFVNDVISYKGHLYAVIDDGALLSIDVEKQSAMLVAGHALNDWRDGRRYLVESTSGDLILVLRIVEYGEVCSTVDFFIYKLEEIDETKDGILQESYICSSRPERIFQAIKYRWVELESASLDDQILFIGRNYSKSVSASLYPGLKGNCIYFTDDDPYGRHLCVTRRKVGVEGFEEYKEAKNDMGIYDMGVRSFRPIPVMDEKFFRLPPVWLEPNPWLQKIF